MGTSLFFLHSLSENLIHILAPLSTMDQNHQFSVLRQVRESLLLRIKAVRPKGLHRVPKHARHELIIQTLRADARILLQFEPSSLSPSEVASRLARLSVLYAESPTKLLPQLSEFPRVLAYLASAAIPSHISALLLSLLLISVGCAEKDADSRFNSIFSLLLSKWPSYSSFWHPADYVAIADTVSVALLLRFSPARAQKFPQSLADLFLKRASLPQPNPDLTALSFAAAIISSFKTSQNTRPIHDFFVQELSLRHDLFMPILRQNTLATLTARHAVPTAMVMLISVGDLAAHIALPRSLQVTIVRSLETILLNMELNLTSQTPNEFHTNLHDMLLSRMENIGTLYAVASATARVTSSSANFVAQLVTFRTLVRPITPFALSFVTECTPYVTPQVAVTFASILTYLSKLPTAAAIIVSSAIAKEACGVARLLSVLVAMLSDAQKTNKPIVAREIFDRASKLGRLVTVTLTTHQNNRNVTCEGWLEPVDDSVFELSARIVVESVLDTNPEKGMKSFVQSGLEMTSAFARSTSVYFKQAREWVIVFGVPAIFQKFFGEDSRWIPKTTIVQMVARVFDSVADGTSERALVKSCLDGIVPLAFDKDSNFSDDVENNERSRVVYILLLRFMLRCDLSVIDLALDAVDRSLGSSNVRKHKWLRPAQIAVLGSELGRKEICVRWLLRTFNDLGSPSYENRVMEGRYKNGARAIPKL